MPTISITSQLWVEWMPPYGSTPTDNDLMIHKRTRKQSLVIEEEDNTTSGRQRLLFAHIRASSPVESSRSAVAGAGG
jgi:hypothetical protein